MFGSQILEVGIGLILVFLLVSLILTAVRETIEAWMKSRSKDLEHAIAELLDDKTGTGIRKTFYEHPLITALYKGNATLSNLSGGGAAAGGNLPSYIPRETFALALQDIMNKKQVTSAHVTTVFAAMNTVAGGRPEVVRQELEQWYDAAMDRASGWYRRRTQTILFWLGLAVALLFNINAVTIGQYLATDDIARQQVAKVSERMLADPNVAAALAAPPSDPVKGPAITPPATGAAKAAPATANAAAAGSNAFALPQATPGNGSATANGSATPAPAARPAEGDSRVQSQGQQQASAPITRNDITLQLQAQLQQAGLPIGWNSVQLQRVRAELSDHGWIHMILYLLTLIAGWIAVGFAATLGAPFWFDLLDKFMVVRSTVKPMEKSPDEGSKNSRRSTVPSGPPDPAMRPTT